MQWDHAHAGLEEHLGLGHKDGAVHGLVDGVLEAPDGDAQHVGAAGGDLLDVGHGLVKESGIGGRGHHQRAVFNEGDGAVLELTGGVGLGVDVSDLLELQAPLQAGGAVQVPADEEHVPVVEILGGVVLDGGHILRREHLLQLFGELLEGGQEGIIALR